MARILVIDDEPAVRSALQKALKSAGHEVVLAADGREGLASQLTSPADLVITDIFMPNQEGLATLIELKKTCPETAVIVMSGKPAGPMMLSIAHTLGATKILQKPFGLDEFLEAVNQTLMVPQTAG
jgi:DNA-binding NtrC family response regulator